jgi:hypothetical protein
MANQARSKNKSPKPPRPELEPISYEEIMGNAGMSGFVSFLDEARLPGQGAAQVDTVQEPDTVQDSSTVQQSKSDPDTVSTSYTVQASDTVIGSDTVQQSKSAPQPYTVQARSQARRLRVTRARAAEDGHSLAEEQLYRLLWDAGAPEEARAPAAMPDSRLVRIGYDRLAAKARMSWLTVKNNLRTLEKKLAIEVAAAEDSAIRAGKQYRVFSAPAVFARRESAGLVWVRRTRGVELLTQLPPGSSIE